MMNWSAQLFLLLIAQQSAMTREEEVSFHAQKGKELEEECNRSKNKGKEEYDPDNTSLMASKGGPRNRIRTFV
jgi:hypothetical protein